MPKRATVPGDAFGQKASALDKLTGRAVSEEVAPPEADIQQNSNTVKQQNGKTVLPQNGETEKVQTEKVSFYLRPDQLDKLEDLVREYRKRTGQRLNRNELVRMMIDRCELEMLVGE